MAEIDRGLCEILAACDEDDYALWEIAGIYNRHSDTRLSPSVIAGMMKLDLVCLVDVGSSEIVGDVTLTPADLTEDDPRQVRLRITEAGRAMYYSDSCARFQQVNGGEMDDEPEVEDDFRGNGDDL